MSVSAATLQSVLERLFSLRLDALTFFRIAGAIGPPLLDEAASCDAVTEHRGEHAPPIEKKSNGAIADGKKPNSAATSVSRRGADGRFHPTAKAAPAAPHRKASKAPSKPLKPAPNGRDADRIEIARVLLAEALSQGPVAASDIDRLARERRIGDDALDRAKSLLGVTARRLDTGHGGSLVCFSLPDGGAAGEAA